jgi:hypothetical protein
MPTQSIARVVSTGYVPSFKYADGFSSVDGILYQRTDDGVFPIAHGSYGAIVVDPLGPITTLTQAFSKVTADIKTILLNPGEYTEPAAVNWPTLKGVSVIGIGGAAVTQILASAGTKVINVAPGVQTSSFTGLLQGVEIVHDLGSQSGIRFDNTGMTKKLGFNIVDCMFSPDDGEVDNSIDVAVHGDAGNSIRIYVQGKPGQNEIGGRVYFKTVNNADRLHLENCWLVGGDGSTNAAIYTSSDAIEFRLRLFRCVVPHNSGTSGGNGLQRIAAVNCYSWIDYDDLTQEIFAALDSNDMIGSHTEQTIVA